MKIIDSNNGTWDVTLQNNDKEKFVKKVELNGEEYNLPKTEFSIQSKTIKISQGGQIIIANVIKDKDTWWVNINGRTLTYASAEKRRGGTKITQGSLQAPMPGTILDIQVSVDQSVEIGQNLLIMEAMKMEHKITAPFSGTVKQINCANNQKVDRGFVLIELKQD